MVDSFNFDLVSPERLLLSSKAIEIIIPASEGEMTVMAHHAATMTTIRPGVVTVKAEDGTTERYVVFGGFADILPTSCTLLAEAALPVSEFTRAALDLRIEAAKTDLAGAESDENKTRIAQLVADLSHLHSVAS